VIDDPEVIADDPIHWIILIMEAVNGGGAPIVAREEVVSGDQIGPGLTVISASIPVGGKKQIRTCHQNKPSSLENMSCKH